MTRSLFGTQKISALIPGLALAFVVLLFSVLTTKAVGYFLPWEKSPLSPMLVAIVLGLIIRMIVPLPQSFNAGIEFGVKKLLRFGIILMGIRLSIFVVLEIGLLSLGMVVLCIVSALVATMLIAKSLGVSETLGTLIAAGTSICGVSAIVAMSPAINAKEEETTYAVGTITIFGILAIEAENVFTDETLVKRVCVVEAQVVVLGVGACARLSRFIIIAKRVRRIPDAELLAEPMGVCAQREQAPVLGHREAPARFARRERIDGTHAEDVVRIEDLRAQV